MKRPILLALAALTAASLACAVNVNVPRLKTGPTETLDINEPAPDVSGPVDLTVRMGAGTLNLSGGGAGLVEGQVQYNIAEWKPGLVRSAGSLTIEQQTSNGLGLPESGQEVTNDWNLKLGTTPLNLTLQTGAYEGTLDLTGVPLHKLEVQDGASSAEIRFDALNPQEMTRLSYTTGASSVKLLGLANANFSAMDFSGGAGSYTLDFAGQLQRDADVTVKSGVSSMRIIIPAGMSARVTVSGGLNDVSTIGDWSKSDTTYTTVGEGPQLNIQMDMGVGSLTLVHQ